MWRSVRRGSSCVPARNTHMVATYGLQSGISRQLFATKSAAREGVSLRAALLDHSRRKGLSVPNMHVWEQAMRDLLEPAGLTTVGDILALPPQDVDLDGLKSKESLGSRAKQLRELALPPGLLRYLVQLRAGHHDASLSNLATTLEARRPPATPESGDAQSS